MVAAEAEHRKLGMLGFFLGERERRSCKCRATSPSRGSCLLSRGVELVRRSPREDARQPDIVSAFNLARPHSLLCRQFDVHPAKLGNLRLSNQAHRAAAPVRPSAARRANHYPFCQPHSSIYLGC
jgi:hypothetical protein